MNSIYNNVKTNDYETEIINLKNKIKDYELEMQNLSHRRASRNKIDNELLNKSDKKFYYYKNIDLKYENDNYLSHINKMNSNLKGKDNIIEKLNEQIESLMRKINKEQSIKRSTMDTYNKNLPEIDELDKILKEKDNKIKILNDELEKFNMKCHDQDLAINDLNTKL